MGASRQARKKASWDEALQHQTARIAILTALLLAGSVHAGHDHGAVGSALDHSAALGEGLGQNGLLYGSDPDAGGRVPVDELIGAGSRER